MTSSIRNQPFLNPSNPNQICIQASHFVSGGNAVFLTKDTAVVRLLPNGQKVGTGVKYDYSSSVFLLDIDQLTSAEKVARRVSLCISNQCSGNTRRDIELKVLEKMASVQADLLLQETSSLGSDLRISIREKIKKSMVQEYKKGLEKYACLHQLFVSLLSSLPPVSTLNKTENFSSLYKQPHTELAPRQHKISPICSEIVGAEEEKSSLDDEPSKSFTVHGCVIAMNGGVIGNAFTIGMEERATKELQVQVTHPRIIKYLVDYLYGQQVVFNSDGEAAELYELAHHWEMEPLMELCRPGAMREHVKIGRPEHLPTVEQFEVTLEGSVEEIERMTDRALKQIQFFLERYLEPHITRIIGR